MTSYESYTDRRGRVRRRRVALRVPGHRLAITWSGEYGIESSSTGSCGCGWAESASNQHEVRFEYRAHLCRAQATAEGITDADAYWARVRELEAQWL